MKNPKLKYSGILIAIFGGLILEVLFFGNVLIWYGHSQYEEPSLTSYIILGVIMLVSGIIIYIFVEE